MAKLLLLSVLIMMVVVPIRASRDRFATRGMRKALFQYFAFNAFYWLAVVFIYFTLILGRSPAELLSHTVHD